MTTTITREQREAARRLSYRERLALELLVRDPPCSDLFGVGAKTIDKLSAAGLAQQGRNTDEHLLTERGRQLRQVLAQLDWFPPVGSQS